MKSFFCFAPATLFIFISQAAVSVSGQAVGPESASAIEGQIQSKADFQLRVHVRQFVKYINLCMWVDHILSGGTKL